jgi:hypothetical protein
MGTRPGARWAASTLAALALLAGCDGGPATGEVTGTVRIDGQIPPAGSSITFFPSDGKSPTAGAVLDKGKYSVRVAVGNCRVEIRAPKASSKSGPKVDGPGAEGGWIEELLPAKYHDESELTLEVKSGTNQKDWNLSVRN